MARLGPCLKRVSGWTDADTAALETRAEPYREAGMPHQDSYMAALDDMLADAQAERARFIERAVPPKGVPKQETSPAPEPPKTEPPKPSPDDSPAPGTLRGGIPFALSDVAKLGKLVKRLFGSDEAWERSTAEWRNAMDEINKERKVAPKGSAAARVLRGIFDTSSGAVRGVLSNYNSKTATWVIDQFHTEAGSARATGKTYEMAVAEYLNQNIGRLDKAIGKFAHNKSMTAQVANLVRNPSSIKPGTEIHDAAIQVRKILDDALKYLREAGVDVGEVKGGYYPREFNVDMVIKNASGFLDAAAQAYREGGMSPKAAAEAASLLHDTLLYGGLDSMMKPDRGQVQSPFLEGRVFGKQVDNPNHPLHKFLTDDPALTIASYLSRAARRAEIARRFGDGFSRWNKEWVDAKGVKHKSIVDQMKDEGADSAIEHVQDYVALAAGLNRPGIGHAAIRGAQFIRYWTTMMMLEKAVLTSLTETFMPAVRTGNWSDITRSLNAAVGDLFRNSPDAKARREFAEDLYLMGDTMSPSINAARFAGGDPLSHAQSVGLDKFFRRTGLTQWTDATRVGSVQVGRIFVRRMAKQLQDGGKIAERHLAELGVPRDKADAFSKWLLALDDGMPAASAVKGEMGEIYRTVLHRFLRQTVMQPDRTVRPGWASHPIGAVAFQLQSFNYAFFDQVWKRQARLAMEAYSGKDAVTGAQYSAIERAKLLAPLATMPILMGAAFAIGEARDEVLGDPERRKKETTGDKIRKAASRGAPIAPLEPFINLLYGSRFPGAAANIMIGPGAGTVLRGVDAISAEMRSAATENKSNAADRQLAKATYDLVVEPGVNLLLNRTPVGPASALITQVAGSGWVRENAFVTPLAGEKKKPKGRRKD